MAIFLGHKELRKAIKRKTPCIICIENKNEKVNNYINVSVNKLCKEFPYVLCYKIDIQDYNDYHENKSSYGPNDVIRFQNYKIISVVDGTNFGDVQKLFMQVYHDSCLYNFEGYTRTLFYEDRLSKILYRPHLPDDALEICENLLGKIISKTMESKEESYPELKFSAHKYTPVFNIRNKYMTNLNNNTFIDNIKTSQSLFSNLSTNMNSQIRNKNINFGKPLDINTEIEKMNKKSDNRNKILRKYTRKICNKNEIFKYNINKGKIIIKKVLK